MSQGKDLRAKGFFQNRLCLREDTPQEVVIAFALILALASARTEHGDDVSTGSRPEGDAPIGAWAIIPITAAGNTSLSLHDDEDVWQPYRDR
jgi:hypothetical protein